MRSNACYHAIHTATNRTDNMPGNPPAHSQRPHPPLKEQYIRLLILQPILRLQNIRIKVPHAIIVELPPPVAPGIPHMRNVVPSIDGRADMANHAVGVVLERRHHTLVQPHVPDVRVARRPHRAVGILGRRRALHVPRNVEPFEGELDRGADLARRVAAERLEALEVHDEVAGRARDEDLLRRVALFLAAGALPAFRHPLLLAVGFEAVVDVALAGARDLNGYAVEGLVCRGGGAAS